MHLSCTGIPRVVYLHHILQLWQMKSIPLALLRTLQPVKIQEQLLEWDVSGHTSFENKTVATVSCLFHIYI